MKFDPKQIKIIVKTSQDNPVELKENDIALLIQGVPKAEKMDEVADLVKFLQKALKDGKITFTEVLGAVPYVMGVIEPE